MEPIMHTSAEVARRVLPEEPSGRMARSITRGALRRFRAADGTSHSRALAFQSVFVVLSGLIGMIGLAGVLGVEAIRASVIEMATQLAPGPSSQLVREAVQSGSSGAGTAMVLGLGGALMAGVFAMAQLERSGNRIAGRTRDRETLRRWVVAAGLALSAGIAIAAALVVIGGGEAIASGAGWRGDAETLWNVVRWPLGAILATVGMFALFRTAPAVRLAGTRGLAIGAAVSVACWLLLTFALSWYLGSASWSREAYGPLLSIVALTLWAGATSLAVHLGMAVAAELGASGAAPISVPDHRGRAGTAGAADDGGPSDDGRRGPFTDVGTR
jgi:YihY family inner membrane protein